MSNTNNKDYDNLVGKGLISKPAQKNYSERLEKIVQDENKRLEESAKKRKSKNEKFMANLPEGLTFIVGNFEITI